MKYLLYRFPDALDWGDEDDPQQGRSSTQKNDEPRLKEGFRFPVQAELVAVEYGEDIYQVTNSLIQAVDQDLSGMAEYARFDCCAYAPDEPFALEYMTDDEFDYEMSGIVCGGADGLNKIIYFGVKEAPGSGT